jgi:hypothetical protein
MTKLIADGPEFACIITFLAIVKCKDKQGAAQWLGLAKGTPSKHVDRLERWLGHKLFTNSRPPQLTPKGRQALEIFESFARSLCVMRGSVPTFGKEGYVSDPECDILNALVFAPKVI